MAHYNSRCLLDDPFTRITVVIQELIHANKPEPHGKGAFIRINHSGRKIRSLVNLNNTVDRTVKYRRRIFQMSVLSTFDGSLYDYHGCYG
jgi:hypothetical protein